MGRCLVRARIRSSCRLLSVRCPERWAWRRKTADGAGHQATRRHAGRSGSTVGPEHGGATDASAPTRPGGPAPTRRSPGSRVYRPRGSCPGRAGPHPWPTARDAGEQRAGAPILQGVAFPAARNSARTSSNSSRCSTPSTSSSIWPAASTPSALIRNLVTSSSVVM